MIRQCIFCALVGLATCPSATVASAENPRSLSTACAEFRQFDHDGDGQIEIESLEPVCEAGEEGRSVLMLVERRLLEPLDGATDLRPKLERWARDLASEGFRAQVVAARLAPSPTHQDGRYVLALREFLRRIQRDEDLAGLVLVGRFPDAYIVRTCNWRRRDQVSLAGPNGERQVFEGKNYVRRVPEPVAQRADIVLADLDGRWEEVYFQPRTEFESIVAVLADGMHESGGPCLAVQTRTKSHEDCFHVADGALEVVAAGDDADAPPAVAIHDEVANHECSARDGVLPNPIAQPDILVSRLDARGVALRPRRDLAGVNGEKLLDDEGRPQAVSFPSAEDVPHWCDELWEADPALERRLLAEYFDRNHAFRNGQVDVAWRPASIACDLPSGYRVMQRAADDWRDDDRSAADVHGRPTLTDFVAWMSYPAVLRTVRAHTDPLGSQFRRARTQQLDAELSGPAWSWTQSDERLEPSLAAACRGGQLNWFLLRSLYENGRVAAEPCFYHHTGCDSVSPYGAPSLPYDDARYGQRQSAEALLLFGNGLALIGRAKVFYDEPRGFAETFGGGETFGRAWSKYFEIESSARSFGEVGGDISRKRAYFWSVLGDWTLRMRPGKPAA